MADLRPILLQIHLDNMNNGYSEGAHEALQLIATYLEAGEEIPENARLFVAGAFKKIAQGDAPQDALKLNGRKNSAKADRNITIAKVIYWTIKEKNLTPTEVIATYAKEGIPCGQNDAIEHLTENVLKAVYYKYKDALENSTD